MLSTFILEFLAFLYFLLLFIFELDGYIATIQLTLRVSSETSLSMYLKRSRVMGQNIYIIKD